MNNKCNNFSVLISVYNKDNPVYFDVALHSIYAKQSLKPDQIVIVADGHLTDKQNSIISSFRSNCDKDIVTVVSISENVGLAEALNEGLRHCKNELVARMDADDISLPERFEKQVAFMKSHPDIDVCGTYIDEIEPETEQYISTRKVPLNHEDIYKFSKKRNPISHPSVIFKKSKILELGGYPSFKKSQDFALWSLMLVNGAKFANLEDILLRMRTGNNMMIRRGLAYFKYEFDVLRYQRRINFLSNFEFIINCIIRFLVRVLPVTIKKIIYKNR
ncbi:glycosyltransferase [Escherichia coli]|uniref:glycosyltransferase n=1 Tax=Enterobacteriaceae TaxID=543 RepID=UPI0007A60A07|nr:MULTISPECIES: glycosyltransferase [Enterobacteriaceae]EFB2367917.1 glycosyltransferase [Escherichia coli]EGK5220343.1 glycosyltransferase [Escherichia coli]EJV8844011.1 glycosyltransferase [Escherichia coli]QPE59461.1 glycosyltransferase [Escherichia coli]QPF00763.1 glycosyltransferase [Escherichia coli]